MPIVHSTQIAIVSIPFLFFAMSSEESSTSRSRRRSASSKSLFQKVSLLQEQLENVHTKFDLPLGGLALILDKYATLAPVPACDFSSPGHHTPPMRAQLLRESCTPPKLPATQDPHFAAPAHHEVCSDTVSSNGNLGNAVSGNSSSKVGKVSSAPLDPHQLSFADRRRKFSSKIDSSQVPAHVTTPKPEIPSQIDCGKVLDDSDSSFVCWQSRADSLIDSCLQQFHFDDLRNDGGRIGGATMAEPGHHKADVVGSAVGNSAPLDVNIANVEHNVDVSSDSSSDDSNNTRYNWSHDPEYIAFLNGTWHPDM